MCVWSEKQSTAARYLMFSALRSGDTHWDVHAEACAGSADVSAHRVPHSGESNKDTASEE